MSDLINRDALKKELNSRVFQGDYTTTLLLSSFNDLIDNAPTVEAFTKEDMAGAYNEGYMCGNKECRKCAFYNDGCSIGYPFEYKEINDGGRAT